MKHGNHNCALCGSPLVLLGLLGRVRHYRCRGCGITCSKPMTKTQVKRRDGKPNELYKS